MNGPTVSVGAYKVRLMSQQRRGEFHKIVHVFKITRRMIPNAGIIIKTKNPNETRSGGGIQCIVPSLKGKSVRTLKDEAFGTGQVKSHYSAARAATNYHVSASVYSIFS